MGWGNGKCKNYCLFKVYQKALFQLMPRAWTSVQNFCKQLLAFFYCGSFTKVMSIRIPKIYSYETKFFYIRQFEYMAQISKDGGHNNLLAQPWPSSCWPAHIMGILFQPTHKRFNSAYLQNKFCICRKIPSNTLGLYATFSC